MTKRLFANAALAAGLAALALTASLSAASARGRYDQRMPLTPDDAAYHWITVDSIYGAPDGVVSAPVRPGPRGFQVRLPGGAWVYCAENCYETLRRETVDFWHFGP